MMFRWLSKLVHRPVFQVREYQITSCVDEIMESHFPELAQDRARQRAREGEEDRQRHETEVRRLKKARLNQELDEAGWILDYERRLAKLQERVAAEVNRTGDRGRSPKRLQKLQSHLHDVRSSLTLD